MVESPTSSVAASGDVRELQQHAIELRAPLHLEALARADYLLDRPFGCGVLLGPAGSGKSQFLRVLTSYCRRRTVTTALVNGAGLDAAGLGWELAAGWRLEISSTTDDRTLWRRIDEFVDGALDARQRLAILIDHADRLESCALSAAARLLHRAENQRGMTFIWAADVPISGAVEDLLLPLTELRIDWPAADRTEIAALATSLWRTAGCSLEESVLAELASSAAGLANGDRRRTEHLCRLSVLAAEAEGRPLSQELLEEVVHELP